MTSGGALPLPTDRFPVSHGEDLIRANGECWLGIVPQPGGSAVHDFVGVAAQTDRTSGKGPSACAGLKVRFSA